METYGTDMSTFLLSVAPDNAMSGLDMQIEFIKSQTRSLEPFTSNRYVNCISH